MFCHSWQKRTIEHNQVMKAHNASLEHLLVKCHITVRAKGVTDAVARRKRWTVSRWLKRKKNFFFQFLYVTILCRLLKSYKVKLLWLLLSSYTRLSRRISRENTTWATFLLIFVLCCVTGYNVAATLWQEIDTFFLFCHQWHLLKQQWQSLIKCYLSHFVLF